MDKGLDKVLMYAATKGNAAIINELLRRGADINAQNDEGYTGLMLAAIAGNEDTAIFLLEAGASTSLRSRYKSLAILEAVRGGSAAIVRALIKHGADVDWKDEQDGMTALRTAVQ